MIDRIRHDLWYQPWQRREDRLSICIFSFDVNNTAPPPRRRVVKHILASARDEKRVCVRSLTFWTTSLLFVRRPPLQVGVLAHRGACANVSRISEYHLSLELCDEEHQQIGAREAACCSHERLAVGPHYFKRSIYHNSYRRWHPLSATHLDAVHARMHAWFHLLSAEYNLCCMRRVKMIIGKQVPQHSAAATGAAERREIATHIITEVHNK